MTGVLQILRGLGPVKLAAIGSVMLGVIGFFVYLLSQASNGNMALLYSQLDPADAAKIVEKLESEGVPHDIRADGTQIFVPAEKVSRMRMDMAQSGLPSGGIIGYELFDRGDVLSTSGSMIDINKLRALEGELAKSIKTISGVAAARIHLVMPKRELFSKDKVEPSASILIKMKGSGRLSNTQVQAIQNLVASAVAGLPTDRIAIVDDHGNLLAKTSEGASTAHGLMIQQEATIAYEMKTAKNIEALIERTLGPNKVRVEVSADIDFDQVTINAEKYDPDGQVVRSTNNSKEDSSNKESGPQNVSVQNALPQNDAEQGGQGGNSNQNRRNDENINYEISRTTEIHQKQAGSIKSLSVAVLVDGVYSKDDKGKSTYAPRSKEELEQIKLLVKTAIGFKDNRGDKVEVINMPFVHNDIPDERAAEKVTSWFDNIDVTRIVELLVLAAVGILILLMIVRPVLLRVVESSGVAELDSETAALLASAQGEMTPGLPDYSVQTKYDPLMQGYSEDEIYVDMDNVDGRVKASSVKKISEIINKHPDEAVVVLRNWMYEEPWKQEKTISA